MINNFVRGAETTDVPKHLYWAGKMSVVSDMLSRCLATDVGYYLELLDSCNSRYKTEIDNLVNKNDS